MSSRRSSFSFSASTGSQRGSPLASAILPQSSVGPGPSLRCDSTARVGRRASRTVRTPLGRARAAYDKKRGDCARRGPAERRYIYSNIPDRRARLYEQDATHDGSQESERAAPPLQQKRVKNGWRQKQQQRLSSSRAPVRVQRVPSGATYTSCVSHGQQQTHGNTKRAMRIVMMPQCFSMV